MSEVDVRKLRDGREELVPLGIRRFHRYAGVPNACPHPSAVIDLVPDFVMHAFLLVMNAPNATDREEARRAYMSLLADEVMNQNPIPLKKIGPKVRYQEAGE